MYYRNTYYSNAHFKAIMEYIEDIKANKLPVKSAVKITKEEKMRQYAIYNIEHLDISEFKKKFGIAFTKKFPKLYHEMKTLKLATQGNNRIQLTTQGLNYRDLIAKQFFSPHIAKLEKTYRYSVNIIIFGFS